LHERCSWRRLATARREPGQSALSFINLPRRRLTVENGLPSTSEVPRSSFQPRVAMLGDLLAVDADVSVATFEPPFAAGETPVVAPD